MKQRKKNSPVMLFLKVFGFTLVIGLGILGIAAYGLKSYIKPPEIPEITVTPEINPDDLAYLPPEGHEEDLLVGGGLTAPEGFTNEDRKELFFTFLIVGKDEGVNTDTIMVASYNGVQREAHVISVPRDSMVNVSRNLKKINAAYPAGTLYGAGTEGGIEQLRREIKTIIGFAPDFYICVDLEAFEMAVDLLGGVAIDVPFQMDYDDPTQDLHIHIPEGRQQLDGAEALKFVRYRKGNYGRNIITDYQRIEHQQMFLKAAMEKLIRPETILKIPDFINIYIENVETDLNMENLLWFANELNHIRGTDALSCHTLPTTGTSGLPNYYEYLDEAGIVALVNETINPFKIHITREDLDIAKP